MQFFNTSQFSKRNHADILLLPFWEDSAPQSCGEISSHILTDLKYALQSGDFTAKEGETLVVYPAVQKEPRILLLGLGKKESVSIDSLRRAFASAVRLCHKKKVKKLNLVYPQDTLPLSEKQILKGICEGILLTNYKWDQLKSSSIDKTVQLLEDIEFIGFPPKYVPELQKLQNIAEAVYLARDLINGNADDVTPKFLAQTAKNISKQFPKIKTTVLNERQIVEAGMGLLSAVGRGATHEPAFIIMQYRGNPQSKDVTAFIGKGITYDTGGLNMKPTGSMETMRDDMSGGAAVMGAISAIAAIGLKANVIAIVPAAENATDGNSFKPGDVYKSFSGKTVEIGNTDAEGRLALADALSYAVKKFKPTRMIDIATLTGAMVIALGDDIAGMMSNTPELAEQLLAASRSSSELLWELPLHQPYKDNLKSEIADIKNIGGRPGGSINAALFLQEFIDNIPWAHIDIAGTAFNAKERHYTPKNGVGFGVRLLVEFMESLVNRKNTKTQK